MNFLLLLFITMLSTNAIAAKPDRPPGQLKKDIRALPEQARTRALEVLQTVPAADHAFMRVDMEGVFLYVDEFPVEVYPAPASTPEAFEDIDPTTVFKLHSHQGSANVFYLDFDGMDIEGRSWNTMTCDSCVPKAVKPAKAWDPAGDGPSFNQMEVNQIYHIWQRVVDSFAGFDVDITTEEPTEYTSTMGIALVTEPYDKDGDCIFACSAGGVAFVRAFGTDRYHQTTPALIYASWHYDSPSWAAAVISHELGHNLWLFHHGFIDTDGTKYSYYGGHGVGLTSWGPTMGSAKARSVNGWHTGEYLNAAGRTANNPGQNDVSTITGLLGTISDIESNTPVGAGVLSDGIINDAADVDWYYVDLINTAELTISATPSWSGLDTRYYPAPYRRHSRLDIRIDIINPQEEAFSFDNPSDTEAIAYMQNLPDGRYYIGISGIGSENYSDYDSIGEYSIGMDVTDTPPPPIPDPELSYATQKIKGARFTLSLAWKGLKGETADIYRWGTKIDSVPNTGTYSTQVHRKDKGTAFKVCTDVCTNSINLRF